MKKLKKKKSYWFAQYHVNLTNANNELRQELSKTIIDLNDQKNKIRATISNFEENINLTLKLKLLKLSKSKQYYY
ncbi:hypothetical protein HYD48_00860 [Mycoplasmopsis bovis]|nr:hypothetical protein [Mycoplasmopsis bovis]QQH77681.1 hypothetical protein HYD48_00860 [Mycoplasmopsis bovis]